MIRMSVVYHCKKGMREAFYNELCKLGARDASIREAGNHQYDYFFDAQDPDALLLLEQWEDQESVKAHSSTETFAALQGLKAVYCESTSIDRLEV